MHLVHITDKGSDCLMQLSDLDHNNEYADRLLNFNNIKSFNKGTFTVDKEYVQEFRDYFRRVDLGINAISKLQSNPEGMAWVPTGKDVTPEEVNHPTHYSHPSGVECIDVVEHMGFNLGNAMKYIWRCDLKRDAVEDLEKAKWYIERELNLRGVKNEGKEM